MRNSLIFSSILLSHFAFSAQIFDLDPYKRIPVIVSFNELNRITVENDKIQQIYGDEGRYIIQGDEISGQVFVRPHADNLSPFTVTVITQSGQTQDLLLTPKDGNARAIVIRPKSIEKKLSSSGNLDEQIINLTQAMLHDRKIEGFEVNRNINSIQKLNQAELKTVCQYLGENLEGLILVVRNVSSQNLNLQPQMFLSPKTLSVAITENILSPQSTTRVFIVRRV